MTMAITPVGAQSPVGYAARELSRCLEAMTGRPWPVGTGGTLRLGTYEDLGLPPPVPALDPRLDDDITVDVADGVGVIAGANPRSVLIASYRFLTELGCRWVRPGADGEHIPRRTEGLTLRLSQRPSYRHRGCCIEGAVSRENVLDFIEWLPRVGMNSYFLEFMESYTFFERWYRHRDNPTLPPEELTVADCRAFCHDAVEAMALRGLIFHGVGHGWTCEPLGLPGLEWEPTDMPVPDGARPLLAQVNGKRDLFQGIPLNTNLCYGNAEARRIMAEYIVDYADCHREVDVLHIWLADGYNNQCECELCRDTLPADFFLDLLNDVDARLTARGIPTRLCFLAYVDLMWPPQTRRLINPGRFLFLFAPITRTYSSSYREDPSLPVPPYHRNRNTLPRSVEENLTFLRAWQQVFSGDALAYEYHMMWDHLRDPGYWAVAQGIAQDIRALKSLGLNGWINDQPMRAFFPTGLPMTVMARVLWDDKADFDALADDYFAAAFGQHGAAAREYLARLSELFDPKLLRGEKPLPDETAARRLEEIPGLINQFTPMIVAGKADPDPCVALSWAYLSLHGILAARLARALALRVRGEMMAARAAWEQTAALAREMEPQTQRALDTFEFLTVYEGWFPRD